MACSRDDNKVRKGSPRFEIYLDFQQVSRRVMLMVMFGKKANKRHEILFPAQVVITNEKHISKVLLMWQSLSLLV